MTAEELQRLEELLAKLREVPGLYCPLRDKAAAILRQVRLYRGDICAH